MDFTRRMTLKVGSELKNVSLVGLAVRGVCSELALSQGQAYILELAVCEAVNNSIQHAYDQDPEREVEVRISLDSDQVVFQVLDWGRPMQGFEGLGLVSPESRDPRSAPEGGRGIYIIRKAMDRVEYAAGSQDNVLTMIKFI
ncbi:MAG: ATP-binding protein [Desulfovibrionaceae bacterium]|nr:ATP-binding protein [Desulfovibrionaceae bacterium]